MDSPAAEAAEGVEGEDKNGLSFSKRESDKENQYKTENRSEF